MLIICYLLLYRTTLCKAYNIYIRGPKTAVFNFATQQHKQQTHKKKPFFFFLFLFFPFKFFSFLQGHRYIYQPNLFIYFSFLYFLWMFVHVKSTYIPLLATTTTKRVPWRSGWMYDFNGWMQASYIHEVCLCALVWLVRSVGRSCTVLAVRTYNTLTRSKRGWIRWGVGLG